MTLMEYIREKSGTLLGRMAMASYAALFSAALSSTALAESPSNDEDNADRPTLMSSPEEDPNLENKTAFDIPRVDVNLNDYRLEDIVTMIASSFSGGFQITSKDKQTEYPTGQISMGAVRGSTGEPLILIDLAYNNEVIDRISFSRIIAVKYAIQQDENNQFHDHLLITAATKTSNSQGLEGYILTFYDFPVKDNPELVAGFVLALAERYSEFRKDLNRKAKGECSKTECLAPHAPAYVTPKLIDDICSGRLKEWKDDFTIAFLGQINYDECVYDPQQSIDGTDSILANIAATAKTGGGILVLCGNADELSAQRCPDEVNDNFMLSFYRAKGLGDYVEMNGRGNVKGVSIVPYPQGTLLDERSTKVYYIFFNGEQEVGK